MCEYFFTPLVKRYVFFLCEACIDKKSGDESIVAKISVKMNIVTILTSYS